MDLFEPLKKEITLPAWFAPAIEIGSNRIRRCLCRQRVVEFCVNDAEFSGYFELTSRLKSPFDKIYLKKSNGRRRCPEGTLSLKAKESFDLVGLSKDTPLQWELPPTISPDQVPDNITQSWRGLFQFNEENIEHNILGLRRPQLGALHAISAYVATDRELEPATIVLPTGTGKTETMLATMVYQQCPKILVIVPSDSLRNQIANKFLSLGYLPELGVIPPDIQYPYVAVVKSALGNRVEAANLANVSNVVIATTSVLSASNSEAVDELCQRCSHLFVDEAHHISANSWLAIRERFKGKKVIQFTATPFRNDKKALGGRIIYNYTMGEAQRAGYFTQVNLLPVEEYYADSVDRAIAEKAVSQLRHDLDKGFDHLMMARTDSKKRAESLWGLYVAIASDLNPIVVHSGIGQSETKKRLDVLLSRQSKIVICVDMLGEGYDLPNLKIAALHDYHKSLAVTLQFIGRFTRVSHSQKLGQASVVMNVADPSVEGAVQNLYALGADWDSVLRRLSEGRIEREIRLQEVVDALKNRGNLHNQISLWNLEPSYTAMLFHTSCEQWVPERFTDNLPKFDEYWHAIADDENLLVVLAIQTAPVKWGSYKDLRDSNYKLLIAHWDKERKALFVFSNDYKAFRVGNLAEAICDGRCELISGDRIFNIFDGIEYPLARNLGAAQIGAISFTQYFGPNVTEGLSLIEASQSSLSNIAALGYESGDRVIWGCSQRKGKVWSPQKGGSLADWCDWVKKAWDKVITDAPEGENITQHFLRPSRMQNPYDGHPLSAQWGEQLLTAFEDKVDFYFGKEAVPFYLVDLKTDGKENDGSVRIVFASDDFFSVYKLVIGGEESGKGYQYRLVYGIELSIQRGGSEPIPLPEYMISDPVTIYYADSSFSYNAHLVSVNENVGLYAKDDISVFDWSGVDIRSESMRYERVSNSIQWAYFQHIQNDYDVIVNDDGSGESADLVALKVLEDAIVLTLVHCKFSAEDNPGARLKDLYEVCGQAQRSIRWKHLNLNHLYHHIKHRQEKWRARGFSRFLKGGIADLAAIRDRARTTALNFHVVIVQPGLSVHQVTDEGLKLLGSTALYIKKTTMADLKVIGSA
jgi:superfamily II DNA or RNA helicase